MLSLPLHRHRLRRTTWLTLLAWVLASLAGMVSACQWQPHAARVPISVATTQLDADEPAVHANAAGHGAHHEDHAACLAYLADEASAVGKGESAQTVVAGAVIRAPSGFALRFSPRARYGPLRGPWRPGALMPLGLEWRLALPTTAIALSARSSARPAWPGAALVIRLLRLTI